MKKLGLSLLVLAIFTCGTMISAETVLEKVRSAFTGHDVANHDSVKEDSGCCMTSNVFCLAEKCGEDHSFCLSDETVKDLGITEEQRTKIRELVNETKEKIKEQTKGIKRPEKDASKEECAAYRKKMKEICEKSYPECKAKLEKILDQGQMEKLQTRIFQYYGLVPNSIALGVLNLTDAQKRELSNVCEESCDKVHKHIGDHKNSADEKSKEELKAKIRECRKECAAKVRAILTQEQIAKAERLLSETPEYVRKMKHEHDPMRTASSASNTK